MKKSSFTMVCLMCLPLKTLAGWSALSGEVMTLYSHAGSHVVRTTLSDGPCGKGSFWWPTDNSDAKDMFALALASLMSGKKIGVVFDESKPDCRHGGSARITHMYLKR